MGMIDTEYLKENTPILGYVNADELVNFIKPAQDVHIADLLGTRLYEHLMDGINSKTATTLNTDEKNLIWDHIQPALQYWTIYEYILWANYKLTNKALSKQNSDNSEPSDLTEVNALKSNVMNWAEYYSNRIVDYLKDNTTKFSEYLNYEGSFYNKRPKGGDYFFGGIYIPRQRGTRCPEPTEYDTFRLFW